MELMTSTVRHDWPETSRRLAAEHARAWQGVQVLVVFSALAALLFSFLRIPGPWLGALRAIFSFALFAAFALSGVYAEREEGRRLAGYIFLALAGAAAMAWLALPAAAARTPAAPVLLALLALAVAPGLGLIAWSYRDYPADFRNLGLTLERWPLWLLVGGLAGGILGLHLWLNALFTPGVGLPARPGLGLTVWAVLYALGVQALGEELLFRGSGYLALAGYMPAESEARLVLRATLLNLLVYVAPASLAPTPMAGIYLLLYRAALAAANTVLRHRCQSLAPCLASNVVFSAMSVALGLWP